MIKTVHVCDFCGADEHKAEKVVKGPDVPGLGPVCICDECVDLCVGIIKGEGTGEDLDALRLDAERYRALRDVPDEYKAQISIVISDQGLTGPAFGIVSDEAVDILLAKLKETRE